MNISWAFQNLRITQSTSLLLCSKLAIPLYEFQDNLLIFGTRDWDEVVQMDEDYAKQYDTNAIRRHYPTICFNCHGLTFACKRGWIDDAEIALTNDSFLKLNDESIVLPGDIVAYIDINDNSVTHTGIVLSSEENGKAEELLSNKKNCLIVSKWGRNGEFIHNLHKSPYSESEYRVDFYRFSRLKY
ncbi:hypothetical protein LEP1GSC202_2224 [Leptospira yanagawae serovar Saopaulo str. Sao Paulo = ATCC 700523]|uniref:NlpC/P60 family protein n=1 Tax=Leptospira yanagawae serovar Saopaulo str. Sao Paulo = ATCC 700523 TaxID=1249483 RepID=A0A5E8HHL8_9LEPT|nr:hypothetical protein [Leptospira yanagawae]EOQ90795.1 hypothetical protein LEP1GSC202_2224 [Leptospira yanagawae serovar Saopaulo str. Sao Paulo = ATCC 700523]